jgi:hypothetical protein
MMKGHEHDDMDRKPATLAGKVRAAIHAKRGK